MKNAKSNERHRINKEQLDLLCKIRNNGSKPSDFNISKGRKTYLVRMNTSEYKRMEEIRGVKEKNNTTKRLFFDIETSPMIVYSWRIGYKINLSYEQIIEDWKIITICYKWENEDVVNFVKWDEQHSDKQLLIDFIKIANTADEIIAHNGDKFDIKKIRTKCIFHRVPAFPKYRTLDTLKKARSGFSFNSNKLDSIAQYLGVGSKMKHSGFEMWIKCMESDEEALNKMIEYCMQDVIILEDVYKAMQHYIKPNSHSGVSNGGKKYSCPICASEEIQLLKNDITEKGTISRVVICKKCNHVYNISNYSYMKYLSRGAEYTL